MNSQAYQAYELGCTTTAQVKSFQLQPPKTGGVWWRVLLVTIDGMKITEEDYALPTARRIWCELVGEGWKPL